MKRTAKPARKGAVVALALTWDGTRWPIRSLPLKARAFLKTLSAPPPSTAKMAMLFANDQVRELRICWVPQLKGGSRVLSDSFRTANGRRVSFRSAKPIHFGAILGVSYRRK